MQNVILRIGLRKFLRLKKVKNTVPPTLVMEEINGEEIIGTFYEKKVAKYIYLHFILS